MMLILFNANLYDPIIPFAITKVSLKPSVGLVFLYYYDLEMIPVRNVALNGNVLPRLLSKMS